MTSIGTVRLLDIEPDLGRWLSPEEQQLARRLRVPTVRLDSGSPELDRVLEDGHAFAALLLDGMVMHRMSISGRRILRLLGPGDIIVHTWAPRSEILGHSSKRVAGHAQIALLGRPMVNAARQFPGLMVGLHMRLGDQHQRLAVQLGICQLPRVQDRVLSLMWLLAESWGRVTLAGTRLPVKLTHAAIGELIGARRPTVSLALSALVEEGALLPQEDGWMLLSDLPIEESSESPGSSDPHVVQRPVQVSWTSVSHDQPARNPADDHEQLIAIARRLRTKHAFISKDAAAQVHRSERLRADSQWLLAKNAARRRNGTAPTPT